MDFRDAMLFENIRPTIKPFSIPEKSDFTILIVDDEYINRFLLKDILEQTGYRTIDTDDGSEALKIATKNKIDLILLDIMMPGMDGYEVCRRLKEDERTTGIPVIFVTALTETDSLIKGFSMGAEDYVSKPINEDEVKARVQTHLKLKAAVDKIRQYNEELEQVVAESAKELIRSERQAAFGQLIQGIVHNLKGPLTSIRGSSQACQATLRTMHKEIDAALQKAPAAIPDRLPLLVQGATKAVELVDTASRRLTTMINSLMMKSSSDQSREQEQLDLNEIISEEITFLEADLHFKHQIQKTISLSPAPLPIMAVAPEIAQVFSNLISNAIDAMHGHPAPAISITTAAKGRYALLTVTDNGAGIAAEDLNRIFDPFFTTKPKLNNPDTAPAGPIGTGLGLYMCMRSIKALGGDIQTESTPGAGTTFRVMIPLAPPESSQ